MKLVLATRNRYKIREMLQILGDLKGIDLVPLDEFPDAPEVQEDGQTLKENAMLKARCAAQHSGILSLGEDTGLEIEALGGQPGVRSARFAGEQTSYEKNVDKVIKLMKDIPAEKRSACFRSVVAFMEPGKDPLVFEGVCPGKIIDHRRGSAGFGYDPIFVPQGYDQTFAEMDTKEKNRISHRARALTGAREYLKTLIQM